MKVLRMVRALPFHNANYVPTLSVSAGIPIESLSETQTGRSIRNLLDLTIPPND